MLISDWSSDVCSSDLEGDGNRRQRRAADREERQRALLLGEAQDGAQDAKAVPEGAELAERALRTLLVGRHDLAHRHAQFQGVHCQLGLNLETLRQGRKGLHEAARERAVAGEDIVEALAEEAADQLGEQPVAELVAAAVGVLRGVARSAEHTSELQSLMR